MSLNKEQRLEAFLAQAKMAEEQAAKAKDPETKASWLRIAVSYRELAKQQERD